MCVAGTHAWVHMWLIENFAQHNLHGTDFWRVV